MTNDEARSLQVGQAIHSVDHGWYIPEAVVAAIITRPKIDDEVLIKASIPPLGMTQTMHANMWTIGKAKSHQV